MIHFLFSLYLNMKLLGYQLPVHLSEVSNAVMIMVYSNLLLCRSESVTLMCPNNFLRIRNLLFRGLLKQFENGIVSAVSHMHSFGIAQVPWTYSVAYFLFCSSKWKTCGQQKFSTIMSLQVHNYVKVPLKY